MSRPGPGGESWSEKDSGVVYCMDCGEPASADVRTLLLVRYACWNDDCDTDTEWRFKHLLGTSIFLGAVTAVLPTLVVDNPPVWLLVVALGVMVLWLTQSSRLAEHLGGDDR